MPRGADPPLPPASIAAAPEGDYPRAGAHGGAGSVLVIDDDLPMCQTLARALVACGFSVHFRTVGAVALDLLEQRDFDVVLTDLDMDGVDGFMVCARVTRHHPAIPVVVFTAFGATDSESTARRLGAWAFLTKPFDLGHLRRTLLAAVVRRRSRPA